MKVVTTFHPSSSVVSSLKCHLTPDTSLEHLVVAKINRIDVFSTRPEGLKHECGVDIWGRISALKTVASTDSQDNLLLLTDHPDPKLILLTSRTSKTGGLLLELAQTIELYERNARPAEFLQDVVVNESGRVAIASCYAGKLRAIILKGDRVDVDFDVAVPEFSVLSLAFISSRSGIHALAILHLDHNQQVQLLSRDLDVSAFELSPTPSLLLPPTPLPTAAYPFTDSPPILINVPSIESVSFDDDDDSVFSGGVLVVGGRKIQLFPFASKDWQDKYRGKQRRLESKKKSKDERLSSLAKEKEKDRETKKRKAKANVDWPWSEVTAWCPVSETGTSYIIGDAYGQLALLSLDRLQDQGLILLPLGQVSPPTTLTYLSSQIFYLGSHFGDSQLIRVHSSPFSALKLPTLLIAPSVVTVSPDFLTSNDKGKGRAGVDSRKDIGRVVRSQGNFLEVMNTWKNIAPIMDAVLADTDGSGHSNIVTCSGGKNAGSLRVIRNGADFHEQAHIEGFHDVTGLWSIRPTFKDSQDSHIIVSDGQQSSVFRLNNAETVTRIDPLVAGFITKSPTLAVNNLARRTKKPGTTSSTYEDSPLVVQVTPKRVVLVEYDAILDVHRVVSEWAPSEQGVTWSGREIVLASVNSSQIVLALKGGRVAVLNLNEEGGLNLAGDRDLDGEIAAISCSPINHSDPFSRYVIVGFWAPHRVEILSLISKNDHLGRVCDPVHVPSLPRSLLLLGFVPPHAPTSSEYLSHLLIGLGDGTLVSYSYQDQQLRDKKTMSLGYSPVSLVRSQVDGRSTVLALGTTAAMLFWGKERLQRSPILLKDASAASVVNTAWWQSCLVAATSSGLVIGRVRDLDKMHIRSIPLGLDNPRRLAYSPTLKTFGVGCVRTEPGRVGDAEMMTSSFKVLDDTTFQVLGQFTCEMHHEVTAIHNVIVKDGDSHWCLGTANFDPAEKEPSQGRLYVFSMNDRSSAHIALETVASIDVPGCIYQLSSIDGFIVAAVNSSVVIYRLEAGDNPSLTKVCEWNHNYLVMSLATHGSRLIVGDAISSVSILSFQDDILTTVARDYGPLWPVAVEAWGEEGVVGANSDCNLFTFSIQRSEQRTVLYRDGHYHFDDLVNKIVLGAIHSSDAAEDAIESKALIFTASGQIGVLLDMGEELSLQMSSVQRNLSKVVTDVAGARHTRWRTPAGGRERTDADEAAYGFLDGDFLEQFMNYPETSREMEQIMSGENEAEKLMQKYAHIRRILETLQGMH